jgi:hypothetical protein
VDVVGVEGNERVDVFRMDSSRVVIQRLMDRGLLVAHGKSPHVSAGVWEAYTVALM